VPSKAVGQGGTTASGRLRATSVRLATAHPAVKLLTPLSSQPWPQRSQSSSDEPHF